MTFRKGVCAFSICPDSAMYERARQSARLEEEILLRVEVKLDSAYGSE